MPRISRIVLAASLSLFPTALAAQRCMGGASFADRRAQIGADASFSAGARSVSGGLSAGASFGPFASVGFGTARDDDIGDVATVFAATAGMGLPLQPNPKTQLCPFVAAVVLSEVELDSGERISSQAFGVGASVGRALRSASRLEVVPFVGAALVTQQTTIKFGQTVAVTDHHYAVSVGAGFVVGKVITIRPATTLTVADGRTSMSYGLHFSFSFVRVARRAPVGEGEGSLTTVWVNTRAGVYYCPGSGSYGATPDGSFMTERQALAAGATPAYGRRC